MTHLFRSKLNRELYLLYWVSPPKYTGSWLEAVPYKHDRQIKRAGDMSRFEVVSELRALDNIL